MVRIIIVDDLILEKLLPLVKENLKGLDIIMARDLSRESNTLIVSPLNYLDQTLKEEFMEESIPQRANSKIYTPDKSFYKNRSHSHTPKSNKPFSQYYKINKH